MAKKKIHFDQQTLSELLPYTRKYYKLPRKKKKAMKKKITTDIEKAILFYIATEKNKAPTRSRKVR